MNENTFTEDLKITGKISVDRADLIPTINKRVFIKDVLSTPTGFRVRINIVVKPVIEGFEIPEFSRTIWYNLNEKTFNDFKKHLKNGK